MAVQARKKTEKKLSELVQVRKKAQITLPQSVRQELGIEEGLEHIRQVGPVRLPEIG